MSAIIGLFLLLPLCVYMVVDSILSWHDLDYCKRPMNLWYATFASVVLFLIAISLLNGVLARRLSLGLKRFLGYIQMLTSLFIFIWIIFGYVWLTESWIANSHAIALRYKILFLGV